MVCHVMQGDFSRDFLEVNVNIPNNAHVHSRSVYFLFYSVGASN
jgi:hypothetical protein